MVPKGHYFCLLHHRQLEDKEARALFFFCIHLYFPWIVMVSGQVLDLFYPAVMHLGLRLETYCYCSASSLLSKLCVARIEHKDTQYTLQIRTQKKRTINKYLISF